MCAKEIYRGRLKKASGIKNMDMPERRVMGALLLLLGVSFLVVGIYTGQFNALLELLKKTFP